MRLLLCLLSSLGLLFAADPIVGTWDGKWEYHNISDVETEFVLTIRSERCKLIGRLSEKEGRWTMVKPVSQGSKNGKVLYRFDAGDRCWNVGISGDKLSGVWNGGACTASGVGIGARIVSLEGKRRAE